MNDLGERLTELQPEMPLGCLNVLTGGFMLFMIVERFRGGDPVPVYQRFRDKGRMAPEGLTYVSNWVTDDLRECFQVMECEDAALLDEWLSRWADIVEFEVHHVVTSAEAAQRLAPRLGR